MSRRPRRKTPQNNPAPGRINNEVRLLEENLERLRRRTEASSSETADVPAIRRGKVFEYVLGGIVAIAAVAALVQNQINEARQVVVNEGAAREAQKVRRTLVDRELNDAFDALGGYPDTPSISEPIKDPRRLEKAARHIQDAYTLEPDYHRVHIIKAIWWLARADISNALEEARLAVEMAIDNPDALRTLASMQSRSGMHEDALRVLAQVERIDPRSSITEVNRGVVLVAMNRLDEAGTAFEEAIRRDGRNADAHRNLGAVLRQTGECEAALEHCQRAIELWPDRPSYLVNRGNVLRDLRRYDEARADYTSAITLLPEYAVAFKNRADVYHLTGDYAAAIADYSRALRLEPTNWESYYGRGRSSREIGAYPDAAKDFEAALSGKPKDCDALFLLAESCRELGDREAALLYYNRALELDPSDCDIRFGRGTLLGELLDHRAAAKDFEIIVGQRADDVEAWLNLALACELAGDSPSAERARQKAGSLGQQRNSVAK